MMHRIVLPLTAFSLILVFVGCAHESVQHEERYRIFTSKDSSKTLTAVDSVSSIVENFEPSSSIQAAIEQMGEEGFSIYDIRPLSWGMGTHMFVFRRSVGSAVEPPRRPSSDFTGLYELEDADGRSDRFYFFIPSQFGYRVHRIEPGSTTSFEALWDDRRLIWNESSGETIMADFSRNYRTAMINRFSAQAGEALSTSNLSGGTKAVRVTTPPRATDLERDSRHLLQGLRPQTWGR